MNAFDLTGIKTTTGIAINKLIITETGTYNPQYHRPYNANLNGLNINLYNEITQGSATVTPQQLAGFAGNILQPTAEPQSAVFIPNDFSNRRCVFLMEVVTRTSHGSEIVEVITGFTNHLGISMQSQAIDPNMQFWINNSIMVRRINTGTSTGNQLFSTVTDASHVIVPPTMMGGAPSPLLIPGQPGMGLKTMTPADVVGEISRTAFPSAEVDDYRNLMMGNDVRKSKRINGVMSSYLAKTITGVNQATMSSDAMTSDALAVYSSARDLVRESYISNDAFLTFLNEHTSFRNMRCVTYGELCTFFPALDKIAHVSVLGGVARNSMPVAGQTEYMSTCTPETVTATILSNAVPALMMDLMITSMNLYVSNETMDGQLVVHVDNIMSFADIDMQPYIERFRFMFGSVIYPDISHSGNQAITLRMNIDIMSNTRMSISLNGGPAIDYTIPTFCDGLFAPVVTPMQGNLTAIANVVNCLTSGMQMGQQQFNQPPNNLFNRGIV